MKHPMKCEGVEMDKDGFSRGTSLKSISLTSEAKSQCVIIELGHLMYTPEIPQTNGHLILLCLLISML